MTLDTWQLRTTTNAWLLGWTSTRRRAPTTKPRSCCIWPRSTGRTTWPTPAARVPEVFALQQMGRARTESLPHAHFLRRIPPQTHLKRAHAAEVATVVLGGQLHEPADDRSARSPLIQLRLGMPYMPPRTPRRMRISWPTRWSRCARKGPRCLSCSIARPGQ